MKYFLRTQERGINLVSVIYARKCHCVEKKKVRRVQVPRKIENKE